jgi:Glycosyl hydrolase family 12
MMRAPPEFRRMPLGLVCAIGVASALAGACNNVEPCRPGTVLLLVELAPSTRQADHLRIDVQVADGASEMNALVLRMPGAATTSVEISFHSYPTSAQSVTVTVTPLVGEQTLGAQKTDTMSLSPGCYVWHLALGNDNGAGGNSGVAGHGGTDGSRDGGFDAPFGQGGIASGAGGALGTGGVGAGGEGGPDGSSGAGGKGTGGTLGTGGTTGNGGRSGTGGAIGIGGRVGSGGAVGSGGGGTSSGGSTGSGGMGGSTGSCTNTNTGVINEDASGFVCNNTWGIKGAWYCYSDGLDTTTSCQGTDGKGTGAIPWNSSSNAMCLSGTMGTGSGKFAGIGFKVNSGPLGSADAPGTWDASNIVGFAITLSAGASGRGSGGMTLNVEYPTATDVDPLTGDAPSVTVPGVAGASITYNVLFSDAVLANNKNRRTSVDPTKLTDVKLAFLSDSISHTYDFCIKSVVPLKLAPSPVVATGTYGPPWTNQLPQAVNGINFYAVQSAPLTTNGNSMTMQVIASATGVGFTYTPGAGFTALNNGPGSFPAIISGWGPGHDGIQFYGPYKGGKKIGQLTSVRSNWTFTMGSAGDAVYDVWFSNASSQPPAAPGIELMVWIGNTGKLPVGGATGTPMLGRTPYLGTNGTGEPVISYWVPAPGSTSVSNFDLLSYFQDAASHGYAGLSINSVLLGVQAGFEVYSGSWSTTDYIINIQ